MMMLNVIFSGKISCPRTTCRADLCIPPHSGDVGQENEPWAKEANPLFSQRPYKAGYDEFFTPETGCGQAGGRGEPASLMELGHHVWPAMSRYARGLGL